MANSSFPILSLPFTAQADSDFVWQAGVYTDTAGSANEPVLFATEAGALSVTALPNAPGGITIAFVVAGDNTPFSVVVVGTVITVNLQTDSGGNSNQNTGTIVDQVNASAASTLVELLNVNNPLAPFSAFAATPIPSGNSFAIDQLIDMGVIVRDPSYKGYSNDYVPVALLFPFLSAQAPGWLYPEIYIPRLGQLYFDFDYLWAGATFAASPIALTLGLKGMKVYAQG